MASNLLKDNAVAGFIVMEIARKDFQTTVSHNGVVCKVEGSKFLAKMLHDVTKSRDEDYAVPRDPTLDLKLAFYTWGYRIPGQPGMHHATRRPDGNEFGNTFLAPAEWQRLMSIAGFVGKTSVFPLKNTVYVKIKLSGTKNYLGEFGGADLASDHQKTLGELEDLMSTPTPSTATATDDMADMMSGPPSEKTAPEEQPIPEAKKKGRPPKTSTKPAGKKR